MPKLRLLTVGALAALAALAACATKSIATGPKPELFGTYQFEARVVTATANGVPTVIQGIVHVLTDTVVVDSGDCRSTNMTSGGRGFGYTCANYDLSFDREDPVKYARYSLRTTVSDRQSVCQTYGTDAQGRQICTKTTFESVERPITLYGNLKMQKMGIGAGREP